MSRIRANQITNQAADGAPTVQHGLIIAGVSTFTGSVSIGGTLTYEDVTNIDSIGIVTARGGIHIDDSIVHIGDTNTKIRFPSADTIQFETGGTQRVTINDTTGVNTLDIVGGIRANHFVGRSNISTPTADVSIYRVADNTLEFATASTPRLRIDSSGRVMIGTTTEGQGNADEFTISFNNTGVSGGDQGRCGMTIRSGDNTSGVTQNGYIYFSDGTSGGNEYRGVVAYRHSDDSMYFSTSGTERLSIPSTGGIELKTDGKGIQFPMPQTPTNASGSRVGVSSEMRYYETGTFEVSLTSTVLNSLQNPAFTDASYASRIGRYVRVGHLCFVNFEIRMAGSVTYAGGSTSTAPVCVTGCFPFRYSYNPEAHPEYNPVSIWYNGSGYSNDTFYACAYKGFPGPPYIQLNKPGSGGVWQYNSTSFGECFAANHHVAISFCYPIDLDNADY